MSDYWQAMAELLLAHGEHPAYGPKLRLLAARLDELEQFMASIHAALPADDPIVRPPTDAKLEAIASKVDELEAAGVLVGLKEAETIDVAIPRPEDETAEPETGGELNSTEDSKPTRKRSTRRIS